MRRYTEPPTGYETRAYGEGAERCPETGFIFERGHGALPKAEQTELFKRNLADPVWMAKYKAGDYTAQTRHPELFSDLGRIDAAAFTVHQEG